MTTTAPAPAQYNRYADAAKNPDHTVDQRWQDYSRAEHDRWDRLFRRQSALLPGRACDEFVGALGALRLSDSGIPDLERLSDRLETLTGWRVVPVAGLVPDEVFFQHLAERRFPAGAFIRPEDKLDYLQEPDIFHDVFGHVPMLAVPAFADYMQAYGRGGLRADGLGVLQHLARLYWYTVEFGLIDGGDGLRIYGAGILSSKTETRFALEDDSPHRIGFDLIRLMRSDYQIDDFQRVYFVIDGFQQLLTETYRDFAPIYRQVKTLSTLAPGELADDDRILHRGSLRYFSAP